MREERDALHRALYDKVASEFKCKLLLHSVLLNLIELSRKDELPKKLEELLATLLKEI